MYTTSNGNYGNWHPHPNQHQPPNPYSSQNIVQSYNQSNNQYFQPPNPYQSQNYSHNQNYNKTPQLTGLTNLGNACYMSSVLQAIFDVLQLNSTSSYQQPITYLYSKLQQTHNTKDYAELKKYLGSKLQFVAGFQQQDAHEFLTGLLEILNRENQQSYGEKPEFKVDHQKSVVNNWGVYCDEMKKSDNSKVIDIFGGELYTELRCQKNHSEYLFERFLNVSISISNISPQVYHIQRLLIDNFKEQTLEGVSCEKCGGKTTKNKKSVIYNPPRVFAIHLKRFEQGFWSNTKINAPVAFNQVLELKKEYVHPDTLTMTEIYDLYAIVHHMGSMNGGHYYTEKKVGSQWLLYNDTQVTPSQMKQTDNISETAYILFYKRR